jgi:hypothetical protein
VTPDDPQDLLQTISLFESLIANYQLTRARLLERQREFTDHRAVEISERLAANGRTIESIEAAVVGLKTRLAQLERPALRPVTANAA